MRANYQATYDAVADEYAARIFDELQYKPLDRELLDRFAASVRGVGSVCDLGCGPGQVARYLHTQGVAACGYDLSLKMIELARQLNPGIEFHQGDMTALAVADESWAGIAAFYSIIHIPPYELSQAFKELWRVLRSDGLLLLAFHIGTETLHLEEWWGKPVCVDFFFLDPVVIARLLRDAGFEVEEIVEREPYPEIEHQSRRAYIFARKPKMTARCDIQSETAFHVRRFELADRSAVLTLWEHCGLIDDSSRSMAEADIERKLKVQPELFLIGTLGSTLIATAMAGYDGHRGHLYYLAVSPPHQRMGFGREMIAQVKSLLADCGCHRLTFYVSQDNLAVVPFYERLGCEHNSVISMGIDLEFRPLRKDADIGSIALVNPCDHFSIRASGGGGGGHAPGDSCLRKAVQSEK